LRSSGILIQRWRLSSHSQNRLYFNNIKVASSNTEKAL
jgi:hypothetical protein